METQPHTLSEQEFKKMHNNSILPFYAYEVRDLIQKNKFDTVRDAFNELTNLLKTAHADAIILLWIGFLWKASEKEGNYCNKPYIYQDKDAETVRELDINKRDLIIKYFNSCKK